MNKVQKCVRISAVMMHQARERGPMLHEITLLHPPRLLWITTKQPLNELAHFDVDQAEKVRLRRIERVIHRISSCRSGKGAKAWAAPNDQRRSGQGDKAIQIGRAHV